MDARGKTFWKSLGPGLIWAAAAIGVSHLVQSTRAGAVFGFALVWAILAANLLKYPFFEFGPRYAAATKESLLEGYARLGKLPIAIYVVLTIGTTFTIMAAVTIVTASIATQLFTPSLSPLTYAIILLVLSAVILIPGQYPILDSLVKLIVGILAISTVVAVVLAFLQPRTIAPDFVPPEMLSVGTISFVVALIGWMPSAIDISVWHSMWTLERAKQTGYTPTVKQSLTDFNIGYIGTTIIALIFMSLGAMVMYGSGEAFSPKGGVFASQLIGLYTRTLGEWALPVILIAAFTTMFSTTLTCVDAFSRVFRRLTEIIFPQTRKPQLQNKLYWLFMVVVILGALLLLTVLKHGMTVMVDLATTLSFMTAPVLGYLNLRVVTSDHMPEHAKPDQWLRTLSWIGIVFGGLLGIVFLVWRFILA